MPALWLAPRLLEASAGVLSSLTGIPSPDVQPLGAVSDPPQPSILAAPSFCKLFFLQTTFTWGVGQTSAAHRPAARPHMGNACCILIIK